MKKIAFDIKYRPQIESGEYKVETKNGHPVRIICWDTGMEWCICALVKDRNPKSTYGFPNLFDEKGKCINSRNSDLVIITNEPESRESGNMTEEIIAILKQVKELCNETSGKDHVWFDKAISWLKENMLEPGNEPRQGYGEEMLDKIIIFISGYADRRVAKDWIHFLKSLKDRVQCQNMWISVDKKVYIKELVLAQKKDKSDQFKGYVVCCDHTLVPNVYERYIRLDNNCPQSSWKPSDEQLEALANALSLANNCGEEGAFDLRTLYEQLKKLRGE